MAMKVAIDDQGITLTTKKDNVFFPRSQWLDVALVKNTLVVVVHGIGFGDWAKKEKFERKNPGQKFEDFVPQPQSYALEFKPKKLPEGLTPAKLNEQTRRTFLLAYLDEMPDPIVIRCNDCNSMMDVGGYSVDDSLFCENCSRVMGQADADDHGLCDGCGYYTKLVQQESADAGEGQETITTGRTCHRCRVSNAVWGFIFGVGAAVLIGLVNVITIVFLNRYFPALILFGGLALLWSAFKLVMVIIYSLARKAAGETPLENATNALRKGRTDKAMDIINAMDGDMTGNPGILLNLTRGLTTAKDYDKAGQFAEILIANFPNFVAGHEANIVVSSLQGKSADEIQKQVDDLLEVAAHNNVRSPRRQRLLSGAIES